MNYNLSIIIRILNIKQSISCHEQDPVVFSGSLRFNVDPLTRASDDHVWRALEQAHLKKFVLNLAEGLEYECGENGSNLRSAQLITEVANFWDNMTINNIIIVV